jgi:hypothetical protein
LSERTLGVTSLAARALRLSGGTAMAEDVPAVVRSAKPFTLPKVLYVASIALCVVGPAFVVALMVPDFLQYRFSPADYPQFHHAAQAILHGQSPYRAADTYWGGVYPYPPLPALAAMPLTVFSVQTAGLVVQVALAAALLAIVFVAGVRDWRCYGVALLWPPVISAIETGNVTIWLALGAALAWRFRDRITLPAFAVGVTLALKLFLWPLVIWLAVTRRARAAVSSLVLGAGLLVLSWAVIGFSGFLEYPALLSMLDRAVEKDSYTTYVVGLDLGLPAVLARAVWLMLGLSLIAGIVLTGHRGDERSAFVLAISAALALTPIVWMHYFALLVVVVALAQPRLGVLWFLPFALVVAPGGGHPTPFEKSVALLVVATTIVLSLWVSVRAWRCADQETHTAPNRGPEVDVRSLTSPRSAKLRRHMLLGTTFLAGR